MIIGSTQTRRGNPLWLPLFSYAQSKGDYSESKGDYSESKGDYSESKGDYSESKGNYNESKGNHKGLPLRKVKSPIKGQPQGVARTL